MEMKDMTLEVFCATTASNEPAADHRQKRL